MYEVIKAVIESGRYELYDMLKKIDTCWVQGDITDEQRTELVKLAQENANPDNSYAPLQKQIDQLFEADKKFAEELKSVADRVTKLEGGEVEPEPEPEEWPKWYKWDGVVENPWQKDSKCTHNGEKWISMVNNNVWEPGAEGVHETIWKYVEATELPEEPEQ